MRRTLIVMVLFFLFPSGSSALSDIVDGLYASTYGDPQNQPILFLHGGPGYNSRGFQYSTAETLAQRKFYVVVFDQRGGGRSSSTSIKNYTFANAVKDVQSIIDYYRLKDTIIIGHSYGGTLAIKYGEAHPKSYRAILLVDAPLDENDYVINTLDRCERFFQENGTSSDMQSLRNLRTSITRNGYVINFNLTFQVFSLTAKCKLFGPKETNPSRDALLRHNLTEFGRNPVMKGTGDPLRGLVNDGFMTGNLFPTLQKLRSRTYVIFGEDDELVSSNQLQQMKETLAPDHFVLLKGAGHTPFIDRQAEFLDFLIQIAGTSRP